MCGEPEKNRACVSIRAGTRAMNLHITRINGHLWRLFFSRFGYGKLLELDSTCNSLNNLEGCAKENF